MINAVLAYRNLNSRSKMLLGLSAVIGLLAIGNLFGLVALGHLTSSSGDPRDGAFRKVMHLTALEGKVDQMARAAATATPEAHARAQTLGLDLAAKIAVLRNEFGDDKQLGNDLDDLRRRLETHLRQSKELLDLATHREWAAFEGLLKNFQESQQKIFARVAETKGRCLQVLEGAQRAFALRARSSLASAAAASVLALFLAGWVAFRLSCKLTGANAALEKKLAHCSAAERSLAESEDRLQQILNSVHAGILIVDAESRRIVDVNAFALELMGASREEVIGQPCRGTACPENELCPLSIEGTTLENCEGQIKRADGWCLPILRSVVPLAYGGGTHFVESFIDLSEVKRQEKALRDSEQRYRTLFACAQDAIFILDARPGVPVRIVDLNPAAARMHGYSAEELVGRPLEMVDAGGLLDEGRDAAIQRGEWVFAEITQRRRDGTLFPVQVTAGPLDYADARHILAFGRDVTEAKQAREELEAFNERLRRSNQDLEEFAYVASHDLQEPLRKVQAFGDRLKAKYGEGLGDQGRDYLERMQNASRRMQQLIEGLLTFSRVTTQAQPFSLVDLGQVARDVLADLEIRIEQSGGRVDVGPLPALEADPLQMRQLLQNLVGNALKFRKADEPPIVRVRGEVLEGPCGSAKGPCIRVTVEDEGIGFEPQYAERIFGVFQRLQGRGEYEGTGVGLAVCRKIVERHGGEIVAESSPGQGARFLATIPARRVSP